MSGFSFANPAFEAGEAKVHPITCQEGVEG
jgi:hypothetical protein